jgi:hypothetical protein
MAAASPRLLNKRTEMSYRCDGHRRIMAKHDDLVLPSFSGTKVILSTGDGSYIATVLEIACVV